MNEKRIDSLDMMKALGICMVLALHVPLWSTDFIVHPDIGHIMQYAFRLVSEGVPIFLMINGMLLLKKDAFSLKAHCIKMIRILGIFVFWGIVLTVVGCLCSGERLSIAGVIDYIFATGINSKYTGVLWFLQYLIAVYLIVPVIWLAYKTSNHIFEYFFGVFFFFAEFLSVLHMVSEFLGLFVDVSWLNGGIETLMKFCPGADWQYVFYVFYFCLGGMIWKYKDKLLNHRRTWIIAGIIAEGAALAYGMFISIKSESLYDGNFNYHSIFLLVTLLGLFAFFLPIRNKNNRIYAFFLSVGKNTLGIYLCHYIFIFILNSVWHYSGLAERIVVYFIVFVASYVFTLLVNRIPVLCKILQI